MSETIVSPKKIYELALPNGYGLEENEETIVVYNVENGIGAINITNYQIPNDYDFNAEEELRDFVKSIDGNVDSQILQVTLRNNEYACSEFFNVDRFWKIWTLFKRPHAVFASYNCDEKDKTSEMDKVDKIIQSLKITK